MSGKRLTEDQQQALRGLIRDGVPWREIAEVFDVSVSMIRYYAVRMGLTAGGAVAEPQPRAAHHQVAVALRLVPQGDWVGDALCAQADPEYFFPEKGGSVREAKAVCLSCPVQAECLDYALENDEHFGIWGGLSVLERRRLQGRPDVDTSECGTYPKGYNRHTSRGDKPCDDCRLAANDYARRRREAAGASA